MLLLSYLFDFGYLIQGIKKASEEKPSEAFYQVGLLRQEIWETVYFPLAGQSLSCWAMSAIS